MLVISIAIEQALSLGFLVIFVPYIFLSIILTPVNTGEPELHSQSFHPSTLLHNS